MRTETDAFRTISEVADELGLPAHVLRFWETRFPEIQPMKRAGGRRYYRPFDVDLLRLIRQLLHDQGYTIKGVQRLFKERGIDGAVAIAEAGGVRTDDADEAPAAPVVEDSGRRDVPATETAAPAAPVHNSVEPSRQNQPVPVGDQQVDDERTSAVLDALGLLEECENILARSRQSR